MVEAALAIPFMLLCAFAIIYFGKLTHTDQILLHAAQEGARVAAAMPNLSDPVVRDSVRGFTTDGRELNQTSVIHSVLASASLLSSGKTGDLPPGSSVKILPWDGSGTADEVVPPGTIAVRIEYPFTVTTNAFTNQKASAEMSIRYTLDANDDAYKFPEFKLAEKATAAQQVYQEVN